MTQLTLLNDQLLNDPVLLNDFIECLKLIIYQVKLVQVYLVK